jgi:HK97 family phage portal protein
VKLWPFGQQEKRESIEDPKIPLNNIIQILSANAKAFDRAVTPQTVMQCAPAWACVNVIAETIASLPLQVYERDGDNGKGVATGNPLNYLLHDAPSDDMTSYRWRRYMLVQLLTARRAFSFINRNAANRPVGILPLNQAYMQVRREDGRLKYVWRPPGAAQRVWTASDVLHFTWGDDVEGVDAPPEPPCKNAIGLYMALEDYTGRFFENDARPSLILSHPGTLKDTAFQNLKNSISEQVGGKNKFKPLVLEEDMKITTAGNPPEQSQLVELLERQIREIARVYRVPLTFLQDPTKSSYANSEQQDLHFTKHTIRPWLVQLEQEMNLKLLGQRNTKNSIEFNVDGLLRGDFKTRMDGYAQAIQNAILTPNEVRGLENWPEMDDGDRLMIQQNMSKIGDLPKPGEQPAQPAPQEGEDDDAA